MLMELLAILALILLNGVLAGAEIATISIRKTRLIELVDSGKRAAVAVTKLRAHPEAFLATVQIGITVVSATAAAFGGASVAEDLVPMVARIPALAPHAENLALALVVVAVSFLSLVLGELVPKSLALRAAEPYALVMGRPLLALAWIARPAVMFLTACSNVVLRLFGDHTTFIEARLSRDEILQIVEEASTVGSVDPQSGAIASRALEFSNLDAYMVMVPRHEVVSLALQADWREVARVAHESGHSRVPIHDGGTENVIGLVNLREALAQAVLHPELTLESVLRPVPFVPDSITAPALLSRMQREQAQLVMVIDERGTIIGLATIEDLIEELVGEILSESDTPASQPVREADGSWVLSASLPIHEINRLLPIELPEGPFATLAGLCLHLAGSIPKVGTVLHTETGVTLEILEATSHRVRRVRVRRKGADRTEARP
jgi:putative hemolysin